MKLVKILLNITNYCNLNCEYCITQYNNPYIEHIELNIVYLKELLRKIKKYIPDCYIRWFIQGGEPLLHSHINELLNLILNYSNTVSATLITNGIVDKLSSIKLDNYNKFKIIMSFHYYPMKNKDILNLYNIFEKNILFLQENNINYVINILQNNQNSNDFSNYVAKLYNITNNIEFYEIYTPNKEKTYQYVETHDIQNIKVYIYRNLEISPEYNYKYQCYLANIKTSNTNKSLNLLSNIAWKNIIDNINRLEICNYNQCLCKVCYSEKEERELIY